MPKILPYILKASKHHIFSLYSLHPLNSTSREHRADKDALVALAGEMPHHWSLPLGNKYFSKLHQQDWGMGRVVTVHSPVPWLSETCTHQIPTALRGSNGVVLGLMVLWIKALIQGPHKQWLFSHALELSPLPMPTIHSKCGRRAWTLQFGNNCFCAFQTLLPCTCAAVSV